MENFQSYFLIACVFIMSYFLIIRWDPPVVESSLLDYKAEVSTNLPAEDFGFIDDSMASEEIVIDKMNTINTELKLISLGIFSK